MSRSNSEQGVSPASKTFEWSSELGAFKYYSKSEGKSIETALPFKFIALDKLSTIKGFSDEDKSGIWSNDVKDTRNQKLTVRTRKGILAEGLYQEIKDKISAKGARYATQLYIGYYEGDKLLIGCLTLVGAANSAFIDFSKDNNVFKGAIAVKGYTDAKKGATKYKIPTFEKIEISEETEKKSIELDKEVQVYLAQYFQNYNQPPAQKTESAPENVKETGNDWSDQIKEPAEPYAKDDLPF